MQVHKTGRTVTLYTRNGADWTERFPNLAAALASIPGSAIIRRRARASGRIRPASSPSAQARRGRSGVLWAFDLMALNGSDLRNIHLEDRQRAWASHRPRWDRSSTSF